MTSFTSVTYAGRFRRSLMLPFRSPVPDPFLGTRHALAHPSVMVSSREKIAGTRQGETNGRVRFADQHEGWGRQNDSRLADRLVRRYAIEQEGLAHRSRSAGKCQSVGNVASHLG